MRKNSKFTRRQGHRAQLAEELERRVMLSSAVAAFVAQVTFGVGSQPRGVVTADVNLDGKLDLVVTNGAGNTVGVLLGNGSGGFGTQTTFATGTTPFGVAVADVNRDGKPDLVVANNGSGNVSVLLGNGNGTFGAQQQLGAGTKARFVAVADVNGDGKPDLLVANYGAGTVSVILGNGNGTFAGQVAVGAGTQPSSIAVGDFNRDGKVDLAVADKNAGAVGAVSVLLGNGNGSFGGVTSLSTGSGSSPFSITGGDVNGDGKLDLVVADEGLGVGVFLGNGNGSFGNQSIFGTGSTPAAVVVSDVNGDGKLDIAAANYGSNSLSVLLGNGDGSFGGQKTFGTGTNPFSLTSGDVNRDGRVDLVVGNFGGSSVSVLAGDVAPYVVSINRSNPSSQSTSASSVTFAVTFSEAVTGVDATDFAMALNGVTASSPVVVSGSGATYAVTVNGISGTGTVGLNLVDDGSIHDVAGNGLSSIGTASFLPQQTFATGISPFGLASADLNADGRLDVVTVDYFGKASVFLGNGNGTFQSQQTYALYGRGYSVSIADVNGDGKPDLVVAAGSIHDAVSILLGNGDGTFQQQQTIGGLSSPFSVATGDVNADGRTDIAVTSRDSNVSTVSVVLGNGNGSFQSRQTYAAASAPWWVAEGDFNGDGRTDLVVANGGSFPYPVGVFIGNGNGTFQAETTFAAGGAQFVAVADLNGDGAQDLIAANPGFGQVITLLGNGNGTFQGAKTLAAGTSPYAIAVADVNGDGRGDIVASNLGGNVSVFLGNGDGTFVPQQTFSAGFNPDPVVVADVNRDGRADVLVANRGDNNFSVLLGNSVATFTGQSYTIVPPPPPVVTSIARSSPTGPVAFGNTVSFAVNFNEAVTGVDASDFRVVTDGTARVAGTVGVTGSGASYTVTLNGVGGSGDVQLNLVDDDSIVAGAGNPLAGVGVNNGSFGGASYLVETTFPTVTSFVQSNPAGGVTGASSVSYALTFSTAVTGVDPTDFAVVGSGVTAGGVSVSGGGSSYTVTLNGLWGTGTVGVNLVDNGTIKDAAGNPLMTAAPALGAGTTFGTGSWGSGVTAADLNGDGKADLIAVNSGSNNVSVLLSNGNGTFQTQVTYATATNPQNAAVGDLNGDGKADFVVASRSAGGSVSVYLGNGDGSFGAQQTVGVGASWVAMSDVTGDGKADLVLGLYGSGLWVLPGNGDGTFKAPITFSAVAGLVAVADVNGDGKPDVISVSDFNGADSASVMLGNGNGTFAAPSSVPVGSGPLGIAMTDLNGDGKIDIALADYLGNHVGVLIGNGNGTFQPYVSYAAGVRTASVATSDLNGDGKFDLVVANQTDSNAGVFVGNGNGLVQPQVTFAAGTTVQSATVSDFNGDGRPDLAVLNFNNLDVLNGLGGTVSAAAYTITGGKVNFINRQTPSGATTNSSTVSFIVNFSEGVTGVDASDFKVATTGDVVVAGPVQVTGAQSNYTVTVNGIRGSGDVQLNLVDDNSIQGASGSLGGPGLGDGSYSGPGYLVLSNYPRLMSIAPTSPAGPSTSASSVTYTVTFSKAVVGVDPSDFALVLNGVVATTPVVVSGSGTTYSVTINGIAGNGTLGLNVLDDGTIRDSVGNPLQKLTLPLFQTPQTFAAGDNPIDVRTGDFNGDGKPDLAVANFYGASVSVLLGNGDGTFGAQKTFGTASSPYSVVTADLNGDGKLDIATANLNSSRLSILLGNGDGTFQAARTLVTQLSPQSLGIADFNGDGKPDLYEANLNSQSVGIYFGNGDGTFASQKTVSAGSGPIGVVSGDFNGDGKPDLAVSRIGDSTVAVMMGNGNGTFGVATSYATPGFCDAIIATDVNNDGIKDLVVDEDNAGRVGVLAGNGDGTFKAQTTVFTAGGLTAVAAGDIDGDGHVDLVNAVLNAPITGAAVFNNGVAFGSSFTFGAGSNAWSVALADFNGDGRLDVVEAVRGTNSVAVFPLLGTGGGQGPTYTITQPVSDSIVGTSGDDTITLKKESNGGAIDWTVGSTSGVMLVNDTNGLTIVGNGGHDVINLDYTNGNPLPNLLKIVQPQGGTPSVNDVTINGIDSTHLLSGTTIDINTAKVFLKYASAGVDPIASIKTYLQNGRGTNTWTGTASPTGGAIRSSAAALTPTKFSVGYADSASSPAIVTTANRIELMYTLNGDGNLDGVVNIGDVNLISQHFNQSPSRWEFGDYNYDDSVNIGDVNLVSQNFNQSLPAGGPAVGGATTLSAAGATPSVAGAKGADSFTAEAVNAGSVPGSDPVAEIDGMVKGKRHRQKR